MRCSRRPTPISGGGAAGDLEYVLLRGVNDRPRMRGLGPSAGGPRAHVNLIPYNPVAGLPFDRPIPRRSERFVRDRPGAGVSVSVRKTKGRTIDAACGQFRRRLETDAEQGGAGGRCRSRLVLNGRIAVN